MRFYKKVHVCILKRYKVNDDIEERKKYENIQFMIGLLKISYCQFRHVMILLAIYFKLGIMI